MNIYAHKGYVRASVTCECTDGGTFSDAGFTPCINRDHAIAARINAGKVPADLLAAMQDGEAGPGHIDWTPERLPFIDIEPRLWDGRLGGVVIIGDINGGKSHTAAWLLRQAVEMGMRARWVTALELDHEVKDTFGAESTRSRSAIIARYIDVPLLVLDELKAATQFSSELLGQVIRGRFERAHSGPHPTIITANGCPSKVLEPHIWSRLAAVAPSFRMDTSGQRGRAS